MLSTSRIVLALLALPLLAQDPDPSAKQEEEEKKSPGGFRFSLGRRPTLRIGNVFRAEFRFKVQTDFRVFSPDLITDTGLFEAHRLRVGVQGRVFNDFEYELEYELRPADHPWRDIFVNYRRLRYLQVQGGRFKMPFGMEQTTGTFDLDFVYRARLSQHLAPARDVGVMAHGRFLDRRLNYEAGVFRHDGENAELKSNEPTGGRTLVGRLTARPLQFFSVPSIFKGLDLGGAFTVGNVPEGVNSLRPHTVSGETFFDRIFVKGRRWRAGAQAEWTSGPVSLKSEYASVSEERHAQGLRGNDIPDLVDRAWYVTASCYLLRREPGRRRIFPQAVLLDGKTGSIQLAARYEAIRFGSAEHPGRPSRTPRAANVLGNSDRIWTLGVNWYLNRHAKIQSNAVHERLEDVQRAPISGRGDYWMWVTRLQFVM